MANKIPVGVELYSVRKSLAADLEGTLEAVRGFGYTAVEFASNPEQMDAKRIVAALNYSDLVCPSWHCPYALLTGDDDTLKRTAEFMCEVGCKYPVMPGIPHEWLESDEAVKVTAEKMNALIEKLRPYGIRTGYHNHNWEFEKLASGKTKWSALREATVPEFLMQLDTGNALNGGADVNAELFAAEGRSNVVHLKPFSLEKKYDTQIGNPEDSIDYKSILEFCKTKGNTEYYIIEYESTALYSSDMEGVRWALLALKEKFGDLL
nr:sugar phosphate isomerase/epimerase [Clostridia bacterium]